MRDRRDDIERERRANNEADIDARAATLEQTYGYKIRRAQETLATVRERQREERVQRIYTGRIANLRARLAADLEALASKRELDRDLEASSAPRGRNRQSIVRTAAQP